MIVSANQFGVLDYCLFAATLVASSAIGFYFSCKAQVQGSPVEVLMGSRRMPVIPTALSLLTSFLSGFTLLAMPAESYQRGVLFWFSRVIGTAVALLVSGFLVLPIFFKFQPVSAYQYFEDRFGSRLLRRIGSLLYTMFMMFYMGVVLYAPAVALSGVSGVSTWIFVISVGLVCLVYSSYGGLRAVVWADTLQAGIMVVGILALFFMGSSKAGGVSESFHIAAEHGRWDVMGNTSLNPFQYMTLWTSIFGGIGFWLSLLTFNQIALQRYLSLPSLRDAWKVTAINVPSYIIMMTFADLLGIIMFAYYRDCDPISSGAVETKDQLVIYFALDVFRDLPGMPGVFLACLFSGTLSTVSSGINSMAAVTWEDFFKPRFLQIGAKRQAKFVRLIAVAYGTICVLVAFLAKPLGGIVKSLLSAIGATAGPLVGLFLLGILCPRANYRGAFAGLAVSIVLTMWISVGNAVYKPYADYSLPLSVQNCTTNSSIFTIQNATKPAVPLTGLSRIYGISDILYSTIGIILVLAVGWPTSILFARTTEKESKSRLTMAALKGDYFPVRTQVELSKALDEDDQPGTSGSITTTAMLHSYKEAG